METNETNKEIFIKRLKSFGWRLGGMLVGAGLSFAAENIGLLHLDPQYIALIGLVIGELTKYFNTPQS